MRILPFVLSDGVLSQTVSTGKTWAIERTTLRFWICCLLLLTVILIFGTYGPGF